MPPKLNNFLVYLLPGFFGSLVFFCVPDASGGYRVVKWAWACLLLFCATAALCRNIDRLRLPSCKLLLIAVAVFPASLAFSLCADGTDMAVSLAGISRFCSGIAFCLLTGFIWCSCDRQQKDTTFLLLILIAALSAIPLAASFFRMYSEGYFFEPGIAGTFGNPNWAAGYLVTAIPVAVYALFAFPGRLKKLITAASLLLILCGIAVSVSKTGILTGFVILSISFSAFSKKSISKKYISITGLLLCLAGIIWFYDILLHWLEPRLFIWQALLTEMQPATLLMGNGALQGLRTIGGGMAYIIGGSTSAYMPTTLVDFVHNDYLQALAEGGIVGLVSYLAIIVLTLKRAYASESRLVHAAGLSFLALSIIALADSPLQVPATFFLWWFFLAVIWYDDAAVDSVAIKNTTAVKAILVACMALFLAEGGRQALGSYCWTKSGQSTNLVEQKEYLRKASFLLAETGNVHTEYAQALERSRQPRLARAQALRAGAVKFDYDDLYVIAAAEIQLGIKPPLAAWQGISADFPCLQYPRIKAAELYLNMGEHERAREQCTAILNSCRSVIPGEPFFEQAGRMIEMIDSRLQKSHQ
jgi:hypothetical protein